ncbi:hypothetical protein ABMY26_00110 (plasmid) [Azospirillum sp. HJ39]|uniref:hypothetical protein n=1 Tax=Azospirillum sp. HJ39 TaxID=3159496 RepID=UPI003556FFF1
MTDLLTSTKSHRQLPRPSLPWCRTSETPTISWLRSRTVRQKAMISTALVLGVGLTTTVAAAIGLDQQAAAGFYLAAVTLLTGQCFPSADGMPDVAEMRDKQQPSPPPQRLLTRAVGCRLALPDDAGDVLIDHTGRIILAHDLPHHLGYPDPDFDLAAYAVRNLGMIHIAGPAVHLAPRLVTQRSVEVAGFLLTLRNNGGPVQVSAFDAGAWQIIPCRSAAEAGQTLTRLCHRPDGPGFAAQPDVLGTLTGTMRDAFLAWRDAGGELTEGSAGRLRATGAWDRTVALRRVDGDGLGFAFLHIGDGITAFGDAWRRRMIGKVDDGRPDPAYAAHVSDLYRRSLDADMPAINRVEALLSVERQPNPVRLRYRQLLLPWTIHDGRRRRSILTSITERLQHLEQAPRHAAA